MPKTAPAPGRQISCDACPIRKKSHFRDFSQSELDFIKRFKSGELNADAGSSILVEGSHSAHLYTVLSGWGFRYKAMEDGRRQILNYVMPGDLIGLQGSVMGEMQHTVEAITPVVLCLFQRDRLMMLFEKFPSLAYDLTWIAAREERILDENLLSIGRRSALERAAYLIVYLYQRARSIGLATGNSLQIPITQHHVADTLGLSIVHTNKTLRKLAERKFIRWLDRGGFEVTNEKGLLDLSGWHGQSGPPRPFL